MKGVRYFCEVLGRCLREYSRQLCIVNIERSQSTQVRKLLSPITEVHLREYSRQLCTVEERSQPAQVRKLLSPIIELHLENKNPFIKGMCEPLMRIIEPFHKGIDEPLLRINEPLPRITKPLFERITESYCLMICRPVYGMNEVLSYTISEVQVRQITSGATVLQPLPALHSTTPFIDRETVKAVWSQSLDESKPIEMFKCSVCSCDSKDVKFSERSNRILTCSVRERKRSKVKHVKRDREPSRIPVKRLIQKLRKRRVRRKYKKKILTLTPVSSEMHHLLKNYRLWYVNYVHRTDCFFTKYFRFRCQSLYTRSNVGSDFHHDQYCVSKTKLLMSGDVELNPGPLTYKKTNSVVRAPTLSILESRLHQFGLKALDVGGDGDCFFRAVSHQLYENPNSHGIIRAAGIQFLTENPERFIESNSEHSWIQYLTSMSCQGTWADGIIIQAVADAFNLKIHIIELHPDFAEITLVEGVTAPSLSDVQLPIFIGHLDEFHYVSTKPLMDCQRISQQQNKQSILKPVKEIPSSPKDSCKPGSSCNSRKHFMNICLTQPGKFSCAVDSFLELTFAIFKDSLKHACIGSNDFFQIVVKACLQLENNDAQADVTVVREPVWAYLRQHCYSFATSSDDAVFSDIFTLNTVGVMTQELKSLFLVQQIEQSICSCCSKAISNNTSLFTIYITSLNLSQIKFEDTVSAAISRKSPPIQLHKNLHRYFNDFL